MKRFSLHIIIPLIIPIVWIIASNYPFNRDIYLQEIRMHYKGRIDSIYTKRSKTLRIITEQDSVVIVSGLSPELLKASQVGDSIEKIENKNCCVIRSNGRTDTCQYIFVNEQYDFNESIGKYWNECEKK
jgi:hypothetical protein